MNAWDFYKKSMLRLYPQLKEDEWGYLRAVCHIDDYPKKRYYIRFGDYQRSIGFVSKGLFRAYYINPKGEEITIRFIQEGEYLTHYSALLESTPSQYFFQALESSQVISLPYKAIRDGYEKFNGLERFGRLIAESIIIMQQQRIEAFQFYDAEQRYLQFIQNFPTLFNRVSLSHLATYLGIQRPSLSRIRKKLSKH